MIEIKISKEARQTYSPDGLNPVWKWCVQNFGSPEPNGNRWAWDTSRTFWFHHEADASLFALRWA